MSKVAKKITNKKHASPRRSRVISGEEHGPGPSSKHDQILELLRRKQGASLEEMQKVSNWQPHSVRGFLSDTVKKRLGLKLQSSKSSDGQRRYSVAG
jgi:hypothetical protein